MRMISDSDKFDDTVTLHRFYDAGHDSTDMTLDTGDGFDVSLKALASFWFVITVIFAGQDGD